MIKKKFGSFDLFDIAGASKNISSPKHEDEKHVVMENIATSIQLHHISTVILSNHIDCGAYGGSARFKDKTAEILFHTKELLKAKKIVQKKFPYLIVKTIFISKNKNGTLKIVNLK